MKLNSTDMISRATERTARTLFITFGAFLFAYVFESPKGDWEILGQSFSNTNLDNIFLCMFLFFTISHVIHWRSDYIAYTSWFDRNTTRNADPNDIIEMEITESPARELADKINGAREALGHQLDRIAEAVDPDDDKKPNKQHIENLLREVDRVGQRKSELELISERLGKNFETMNSTAWSVIFLWYGGVPILLGIGGFAYILQST